jgi:hypothetical protein
MNLEGKVDYKKLLAAYKELELRKEKNRIANRKYKKSKKGKLAQQRASRKYHKQLQSAN